MASAETPPHLNLEAFDELAPSEREDGLSSSRCASVMRPTPIESLHLLEEAPLDDGCLALRSLACTPDASRTLSISTKRRVDSPHTVVCAFPCTASPLCEDLVHPVLAVVVSNRVTGSFSLSCVDPSLCFEFPHPTSRLESLTRSLRHPMILPWCGWNDSTSSLQRSSVVCKSVLERMATDVAARRCCNLV